jgi:hypothetical protein
LAFGSGSRNLNLFNKLLATIPRDYSWNFVTVEAFRDLANRIVTTGRASDLYCHYWRDMIGQIEAFSIMSAWRLAEITRSAVWATRRDEVLCAAVMSRAALETAASYAWFQTEVRPAIEKIGRGDTPTTVPDLENKVLVVFASRQEDQEEFYSLTNILTIIGHITKKIPGQEVLAETYEALCEVSHPNWMGRQFT